LLSPLYPLEGRKRRGRNQEAVAKCWKITFDPVGLDTIGLYRCGRGLPRPELVVKEVEAKLPFGGGAAIEGGLLIRLRKAQAGGEGHGQGENGQTVQKLISDQSGLSKMTKV
jgi:hypothetical protein